ncbi:hypothetical protein HAX54_031303 [Datura stramonium]|uniref:Nudix hydrolase domain-containing protein n=1 Tax=Datura stramonium TaxID=4076 RepID=A0ABS8V9F1_DATST|nr:hypothetical protein [Datura stramonium]
MFVEFSRERDGGVAVLYVSGMGMPCGIEEHDLSHGSAFREKGDALDGGVLGLAEASDKKGWVLRVGSKGWNLNFEYYAPVAEWPDLAEKYAAVENLYPPYLHSDRGGWENDETVKEAAIREAIEEAGVRGDLVCSFLFVPLEHGPYVEVSDYLHSKSFGPFPGF